MKRPILTESERRGIRERPSTILSNVLLLKIEQLRFARLCAPPIDKVLSRLTKMLNKLFNIKTI